VIRVRIVEGRRLLDDMAGGLDELLEETRAPVTARRPWLSEWVTAFDDIRPWGVVAEDEDGLAGAALFAERRSGRLTRMVALGHGPSDYARMPVRSPEAAAAVAGLAAEAIRGRSGPWELRLDGLPLADPVARGLAGVLPLAGIGRGKSSPIVRFSGGRELRPYLSANLHRKERKMENRAGRDGLDLDITVLRSAPEIGLLLPEIEGIRKRRDAAALRGSDLEDPRAALFWRGAALALAGSDALEVVTVRLGGSLAAYLMCFLDPPCYRSWDGRFDPDLARYSPGTLGFLAAIRRALEDPRFEVFDFMRGVLEYKMEVANDAIETEYLRAWSSRSVRAALTAPERARRGLVELKRRSPALAGAWRKVKRLGRRV